MLAGMLARLNTLSLDEVMLLERAGGTSAVHQLNSMSEATDRRMQELYDSGHLSDEALEWELITITFCFEQIDARRIIVLQDSIERVIYPLWWDQNHLVSGSNGSLRAAKSCRNSRCFHGEGE